MITVLSQLRNIFLDIVVERMKSCNPAILRTVIHFSWSQIKHLRPFEIIFIDQLSFTTLSHTIEILAIAY